MGRPLKTTNRLAASPFFVFQKDIGRLYRYIPTYTWLYQLYSHSNLHVAGEKKQHHLVVTCTKTLSILHIQKGMFGTGSTYHQQWANKTPQHSKTNLV